MASDYTHCAAFLYANDLMDGVNLPLSVKIPLHQFWFSLNFSVHSGCGHTWPAGGHFLRFPTCKKEPTDVLLLGCCPRTAPSINSVYGWAIVKKLGPVDTTSCHQFSREFWKYFPVLSMCSLSNLAGKNDSQSLFSDQAGNQCYLG